MLRAWLAHDVDGAAELREQLNDQLRVFSSCGCGCASIGFENLGAEVEEAEGVSVFDIDAEVVDGAGTSIGGMMLTIRRGRLHDIDVHTWFDEIQFPSLSSIRWHPRQSPAETDDSAKRD